MVHAFSDLLNWLPLGLPAFVFVITVVIFFHELGHFLVARACGVGVEAFSIGFGPPIVGWTDKAGTRWKVSWIPLGGYVKFVGDNDPASTPDRDMIEKMSPSERAHLFHGKPLWQRTAVVAAGPGANFVLAIVIFTATFMFAGQQIVRPIVDTVQPHSAAAAAGFKPGDVVTAVNGSSIQSFADLQAIVAMSAGRTLHVTVKRADKPVSLSVTPRLEQVKDRLGNVQKIGVLGIVNKLGRGEVELVRYGFFGAVSEAVSQCWDVVDTTMVYLWRIAVGQQDASQLRGPVGIASVSQQVAEIGFLALINLAALISVSIGLVNLFPIPILDGGYLLYYACEAVMGRPLGARAQDVGFRVGLAVMLGLMVLATWNDLVRLNLF